MIDIDIPGFRTLHLTTLVSDYNGTLAVDGQLLPGVAEALTALAGTLDIHVVTADTFGLAAGQLAGLPVRLKILPKAAQDKAKEAFVAGIGGGVVAIGNGRNDARMLTAAELGIALVQREGVAVDTLLAADLASPSIVDALDLLRHPKRLIATLRA